MSPRLDLEVGHVNTNTIWWIAGVLLVIVLVIVIIRMI
jgi:tetrahydromethanopterin S-methyltransferase subunit F